MTEHSDTCMCHECAHMPDLTEHVHECEWILCVSNEMEEAWFRCGVERCQKRLEVDEALGRLNEYETLKKATEALTAEDARELTTFAGFALLDMPERGRSPSVGRRIESLQAYADILEGK